MREIYLVAEDLLAPEEGLCSMELISSFVSELVSQTSLKSVQYFCYILTDRCRDVTKITRKFLLPFLVSVFFITERSSYDRQFVHYAQLHSLPFCSTNYSSHYSENLKPFTSLPFGVQICNSHAIHRFPLLPCRPRQNYVCILGAKSDFCFTF
jgi:hypothetical protein